jgi:hypothetical protein
MFDKGEFSGASSFFALSFGVTLCAFVVGGRDERSGGGCDGSRVDNRVVQSRLAKTLDISIFFVVVTGHSRHHGLQSWVLRHERLPAGHDLGARDGKLLCVCCRLGILHVDVEKPPSAQRDSSKAMIYFAPVLVREGDDLVVCCDQELASDLVAELVQRVSLGDHDGHGVHAAGGTHDAEHFLARVWCHGNDGHAAVRRKCGHELAGLEWIRGGERGQTVVGG